MALSRIERLDIVARSKGVTQIISYARIVLLILTPFFGLLAVNSEAASRETALVAALAAASFFTGIALWLNWRFKVFVLSLFCFLFAVGSLLSKDHPHTNTVFGFIAAYTWVLLFIYYGCGLWVMGRRYAFANDHGFREERDRLDKWIDELNGATAITFPSGSFWTGYWTHRIYNAGDCWVVAQLKRGSTKLRSCRVYELSDVSFTRLPSGRWQVDIEGNRKKKSFIEVDLSSGSPTILPIKETGFHQAGKLPTC